MSEKLKKAVGNIESAKSDEEISDTDIDAITEKATEIELEDKTRERLEQVYKDEGLEEEPAEESEKSEDTTPDPDEKKEPEEDAEKKDDTTPDSEKEDADEKDKDAKLEAKDEDADKGDKKKDVPQLSDAYYRAAIHRGMKPEEIESFYEANPELCVKTLGKVYEAVKRSNEEFATLGRAYKVQQAAATATPPATKVTTEATIPEYKGVDFAALEKADMDPDSLAVIKALDQQNKILFDQVQQTRLVQTVEQPSGPTPQETRAIAQETAAIQQQIENFFNADEVKLYKDFYGEVSKDAVDWSTLSPGQIANRWAVIEMMDNLLTGAHINNRDMKIDEAMRLAHLNISESQREKVIREKLKTTVTKRNKGLSLKPSSTNKSADKVSPSTEKELIATTQERMNKLSW